MVDPWYQHLPRVDKDSDIAWDDSQAWEMNPVHRWVYDKYEISKVSDIHTWLLKDLSFETAANLDYPVILKPRKNFHGMGKGTHVCYAWEDLITCYDPDSIVQEKLTGRHISTDVLLRGGDICAYSSFEGFYEKDPFGANSLSFSLWERVPELPSAVPDFCTHLIGYTGPANVETIGGRVIEVHLRPSLQFYDIDGGLIKSLSSFLKGDPPSVSFEKTYSKPFRIKEDKTPTSYEIPLKPPNVGLVFHTFEINKPLSAVDNDEYSYRVLVVNGWDLKDIETYGNELMEKITWKS